MGFIPEWYKIIYSPHTAGPSSPLSHWRLKAYSSVLKWEEVTKQKGLAINTFWLCPIIKPMVCLPHISIQDWPNVTCCWQLSCNRQEAGLLHVQPIQRLSISAHWGPLAGKMNGHSQLSWRSLGGEEVICRKDTKGHCYVIVHFMGQCPKFSNLCFKKKTLVLLRDCHNVAVVWAPFTQGSISLRPLCGLPRKQSAIFLSGFVFSMFSST